MKGYSSNANWAIEPGLYYTDTSTIDATTWGVLLSLPSTTLGFNGATWHFQIWYRTDGKIATRYAINATGGGSWCAWKLIPTGSLSGTTLNLVGYNS